MLVINDLHLSPNRTGGTTPQSQQNLRDYMRKRFQFLLGLGQVGQRSHRDHC